MAEIKLEHKRTSVWTWLIPLLLIAALIWWWASSRNDTRQDAPGTVETTPAPAAGTPGTTP
jgi:hypothetical protein